MNTDIRLSTGYLDHPKIRSLHKILGPAGVLAHVALLLWVGRTRPYYRDGILRDFDAEDIAQAARWRGNPEEFTSTLLELRLLDNSAAGYEIHNWKIHNAYAASFDARSRSARRSSIISWLIRRNIITKSQQIPPEIDLDQDLDNVIQQFQSLDANRKAAGKAKRKAPSPPPPPKGGRERQWFLAWKTRNLCLHLLKNKYSINEKK